MAKLGTDNGCIYQEMLPIQELGQNPYLYPLSTSHVEAGVDFPHHVQLSLVCTTLSHRINRTRDDALCNTKIVEAFYLYRGLIIYSLIQAINAENKRYSDVTLAGIMTLLLIDVGTIRACSVQKSFSSQLY